MPTSPERGDFCASAYLALLRELESRGYRYGGFEAVEPESSTLILRHDVDVSISSAVALAHLEADAGVSSTYFFLLRSDAYNVVSRTAAEAVRSIAAAGHRIGLHFDPSTYGELSDERLAAEVRSESDVFEWAVQEPVAAVSFHRPPEALLGKGRLEIGRPHTYEPAFFRDIGYCSDSQGAWRFGHPLDHEAVARGHALQLVTHPIWWVGPTPETVDQRIETAVQEHAELLRETFARGIQSYRR